MAPTASPRRPTAQARRPRRPGASPAWPHGSYDVYVTFASKSIYSKAAPFTVYDGGTSLGTQNINESILVTQAQGGRTQGSYGGVGWVELGTYTITSGTLRSSWATMPAATPWTPTAC